jgi:hypothetical protein
MVPCLARTAADKVLELFLLLIFTSREYCLVMNELFAGVLSSLITVAIVEGYIAGRRWLIKRSQRIVWRIAGPESYIVAPIFRTAQGAAKQFDLQGGLLSTYDALGIAHLLGAGRRIGLDLQLQPYDRLPPEGLTSGISLGGPASNMITKDLLEQFFPGFRPIFIDRNNAELVTPEGLNISGWECGDKRFEDDARVGWAFVVRLCPDVSGTDGVMHLCLGLSDIGTAAAAYYLAEQCKHIRKYGASSYFAAIRVQRSNGYRAVSSVSTDITTSALGHA